IDIDLFTNKDFNSCAIGESLSAKYPHSKIAIIRNGVFAEKLNGIKVDIVSHAYPHVKPIVTIDKIRMASLEDIGAMKLHAIHQSGERLKDFVDMEVLLEHRCLK